MRPEEIQATKPRSSLPAPSELPCSVMTSLCAEDGGRAPGFPGVEITLSTGSSVSLHRWPRTKCCTR